MQSKQTNPITQSETVNPPNKMGVMPEGRLLLSMSIPAILSMLIQAFYMVVDSIFVARLGEDALTAISLVFPIQMLVVAIGVGTAVGVNSLIARRLGQRDFDGANHAATHGFLLSFLNWLVFAVFGLFFVDDFLRMFSDDPDVIAYGNTYLSIIMVYGVFMFIQYNIEKILQATGNMIFPMICGLVGAVVKIVLNPILLLGLFGVPAFGISGAASATVIGNAVAMTLGVIFLFGFKHEIKISLIGFRPRRKTLRDIYAVGFPAIIMQALASIMIAGLNAILIGYSETAVAVLGIYFRLQNFIFMPVFGLMQGAMPIFGYNFGARIKSRLIRAFKFTLAGAFVLMLCGFLLFQLFPEFLMSLFNASEEMTQIGVRALRILSICFLPAAIGITSSTIFQSTGHGFMSLCISLLRQLIIILPLSALLGSLFGLDYFWFSFPLSEILSLAAVFYFLKRLYYKEIRDLAPLYARPEEDNRND